MLKVILLIMLTAVLLATSCTTVPQVGKTAPDFQLENLEGQSVSLTGLRGQPVLINFWATWCGYCIDEMPYIQQVYEEWSAQGLVVLAINLKESASTVRQFVESNHLSLPVLLDISADAAQKYKVPPIPTTFFIDKDGIIQQKVIGAFPSKAAIEEQLPKIVP